MSRTSSDELAPDGTVLNGFDYAVQVWCEMELSNRADTLKCTGRVGEREVHAAPQICLQGNRLLASRATRSGERRSEMSQWKCHGCGEGTSCPLHAQAEAMRDALCEVLTAVNWLDEGHEYDFPWEEMPHTAQVFANARALLREVEGKETP